MIFFSVLESMWYFLSVTHLIYYCSDFINIFSDMSKNGGYMSSSQKKIVRERQLKSTKLLLLLLPSDNYCLLKYLLLLLYQIQNAEKKNKMSSENLATLFAPHIMCPRKVFIVYIPSIIVSIFKCCIGSWK